MSQVEIIGNLERGGDAPASPILQAQVRESIRGRTADVEFRDAKALRAYTRVQAD